MQMLNRESCYFAVAGFVLIAVYFWVFQDYFPNAQGRLGHDYSQFLPALLDGYFWYHNNGFWSVPWFTPSFCGGVPKFPNPQSSYISIPQLLTFFTDPLTSVRWTFLVFAGLGFWSFYWLLRQAFSATRWGALLGAGLFLFNGFFTYRMIVGHLTFHAFMVIPWVAFWIQCPQSTESKSPVSFGLDVAWAGLGLAYMVFAGMVHVMLPALLMLVLSILLQSVFYPNQSQLVRVGFKFIVSGLLALALSAAQLSAAFAYLRHFPRDGYLLPGLPHVWPLLEVLFKSLFGLPPDKMLQSVLVNSQWLLERHELEYGVTFVPMLLMLAGLGYLGLKLSRSSLRAQIRWRQWLCGGAALLLLTLPFALNFYQPTWNALLKSVPLIKSSSNLFRWFSVYIPVVILLAVIAVEKIPLFQRNREFLAVYSLITVVFFNLNTHRDFYQNQSYDPEGIIHAYEAMAQGSAKPRINRIGINKNEAGDQVVILERNNLLTQHQSQLACYEAIFGYNLESFPQKTLRPGNLFLESDGVLNVKNPACYVFPEENQCAVGDHFSVSQKSAAYEFATYRPFPFAMPHWQHIANWVSILAFAGVGAIVLWSAGRVLKLRIRFRKNAHTAISWR